MIASIEQRSSVTLWRAPISNDMEIIDKLKKVYFLHLEHEVVMNIDYHMEGNILKVEVDTINSTTNSAWHFKTKYVYTVSPSGDILIDVEGTPSGRIDLAPDMLPRIGVSMHLDKSMEHVRYFGMGPGENYADSKEAAQMGLYANTVDGLFTNYVIPQENGNHMGCKWVSMTNDRGMGLLASTEGDFNFSASWYEDKDLDEAKHTCDLQKRDYIVFNVDYKQNALGSNSCGQWQLDKYRAKFEDFKLSFRLTPFNNKEVLDKHLAAERICLDK